MNWPWKSAPQASPTAARTSTREPVAALRSDVGCQRELNEDSGTVVQPALNGRGVLLVVADGMGGHQAGEVASQAAVVTIAREFPKAKGTPGEALHSAFNKAHEQILRLSRSNPEMRGMGTTCTALAIVDSQAWAAHVGDSRLYLVRGGEIYQLSEDHTQCMELVRQGLMTLDEARHHEDRNVLVRAMGTKPQLSVMTWNEPMAVRAGDVFILCSDGLHDLVHEPELRDVVAAAAPDEACAKLIQMARDRGGYDNITVAVASIPDASAAAPALQPTREHEVIE